jgi:hypothetical protein
MKFVILNGVRRSLASREAGRKTVPAIIFREGHTPQRRARMRLDSLFSFKATIDYDGRFVKIVPPIDEPITVEPIGARGQTKALIPLMDVRLV